MADEWLILDKNVIAKTSALDDKVPNEIRNLVRVLRKFGIEAVIYSTIGNFYNLLFDERYVTGLIKAIARVNYCETVRPSGLNMAWSLAPKAGIKENYLILQAAHKEKIFEGYSYYQAMNALTGILTLANGDWKIEEAE